MFLEASEHLRGEIFDNPLEFEEAAMSDIMEN